MKKLTMAALVSTAMATSGTVSANEMYLDLSAFGGNYHDSNRFIGSADADSKTGNFTEFGFNQILATSLYDMTDGSIFGSFFDSNIPAELAANGVPSSGTALDGVTPVSLTMPDCAGGQCDIDALSPLAPPLASNNEGFLQTWDLQIEYHFDGVLTTSGPTYTGGYFDVYFNSLIDDSYDTLAFSGTLTGSNIQAANLFLYFDITFAKTGFVNIKDSSGGFVDAATYNTLPYNPKLILDTNVNPPIPTADQLLLTGDYAVRQTTLDGSIRAVVPEPSSIALLGLGLLGLGAAARRKA